MQVTWNLCKGSHKEQGCICIYIYVNTDMNIYVYRGSSEGVIHTYVSMYAHVCMYVCMYGCIYTYTYIYIPRPSSVLCGSFLR